MVIRLLTSAILIAFLFISQPTSAQNITAGINAGYSNFSMGTLKKYQHDQQFGLPSDARQVKNFSGNADYSGSLLLEYPFLYFGIIVGHTSTSSELTSGAQALNQSVTMTYFGTQFAVNLTRNKHTNIFLGSKNTLAADQYSNHVTSSSSYDNAYHTIDFCFEPYLEVQYKINRLRLKASGGYEIQVPGMLTNYSTSDLMDSNKDEVNVIANGLRLRAGIAFTLNSVQ